MKANVKCFSLCGHVFPYDAGISTPSWPALFCRRPVSHGHPLVALLSGAQEELAGGWMGEEMNTSWISV